MEPPPEPQQEQPVPPPEVPAVLPTSTRTTTDSYAPSLFHGKTTEDALDFLSYVERYMAYKNMNEQEKLAFVPVLLRDIASDFYDSLIA